MPKRYQPGRDWPATMSDDELWSLLNTLNIAALCEVVNVPEPQHEDSTPESAQKELA